jgi:hypothetical protein
LSRRAAYIATRQELIYMSIKTVVDRLVEEGRLIHRASAMLGISARDLFVTPEIDALTKTPFADTELGERHAALAAYFDAFSELNEVTVSESPHSKPWDVMLARVAPPTLDFWSMRIIDPEDTPGIRVLGGFCYLDGFVELIWAFREEISNFNDEVESIREVWTDYFGDARPHSGETLDEYLTNYYRV